MATTDVATRIELYVAMGQVYESELQRRRPRDRGLQRRPVVRRRRAARARRPRPPVREDQRVGPRDRRDGAPRPADRRPAQAGRPVLAHGPIQYAQLGDAEAAEANLLRGLALDPGHVPTMEALTKQYSDRGDWLKAAQMMVRAESYTPVAIDKVRLLFEAANIYSDKLRQDDQAKQLYAAVIALDPEHVEAGRPLAELYFNDEQWAELVAGDRHAVPQGRPAARRPARAQRALLPRGASTADELGDYQKALGYYKAAYDIDSTYLPTLLGRADLLFKMQDWDNAGKIYQTILVQHRDGQDEADVVRIYNRLGMVRQALGERKKALNMFEKALEIDPTHRETLQAVIDLQQQQGDWEAVVHAKRGLMADGARRRRRSSCSTRSAASTTRSCRTRRRRSPRTSRRSRSRPRTTSCCRSCSTSTPRPSSGRRRSRRSSGSSRSRATRSARARTTTPPRRSAATS